MSLDQWSDQNESLNALCEVIQRGTHGLIRNLSLDLTEDDRVGIRGNCRSYYSVQLVIHTTQNLGDKYCLFGATHLSLSLNGTAMKFVVTHPSRDEVRESVSTHADNCRPQLTIDAST